MIVTITDDFNLERIADSGQCFRWKKQDDCSYRIVGGAHCLYITALDDRKFELSCDQDEFETVWQDYFDLKTDYGSIRSIIDPEKDPFLWRAAEQEKGIRILRQDPWEMLITFIISQNRNIPGIRRSVELLAEACGEDKTDFRGQSFSVFPDAEAVLRLSEQELLACRFGYRWKYVHAAAETVAAERLNLDELKNAEEEETMRELTGLYGVGIKVANCVSLFGLHHLNAFPQDVWMKRVLKNEYPEGYPFEEYSPFNGIYQQYMFAYYRNRSQS